MARIKFAIPKGSLQEDTIRFLRDAGYEIRGSERSYRPVINDPEISLKLLRPQEIPMLVETGNHDIGITGIDWIEETKANVEILLNLEYGRVRLVLAVPRPWEDINSLNELLTWKNEKSETLKISTEYPNITARYLLKNKVYQELYGDREPLVITPWWMKGENEKVKIFLSFGATEAKPPEDADAIVDVTETGTTLEQNNLKPVETIMESYAVLIANKKSLENEKKREKIFDVVALLKGVIDGRKRVHIFVNVRKENLDKLLKALPALKSPTISPLAKEGWYSINTVVSKDEFFKILPVLRKLAQGLVVYDPRQIMMLKEE